MVIEDTPERDPVLAPVAIIAGIVGFIVTLPLVYVYAFVAALVAAAGGVATVYDTTNLPPGAVRKRTIGILAIAVLSTFAVLRLV